MSFHLLFKWQFHIEFAVKSINCVMGCVSVRAAFMCQHYADDGAGWAECIYTFFSVSIRMREKWMLNNECVQVILHSLLFFNPPSPPPSCYHYARTAHMARLHPFSPSLLFILTFGKSTFAYVYIVFRPTKYIHVSVSQYIFPLVMGNVSHCDINCNTCINSQGTPLTHAYNNITTGLKEEWLARRKMRSYREKTRIFSYTFSTHTRRHSSTVGCQENLSENVCMWWSKCIYKERSKPHRENSGLPWVASNGGERIAGFGPCPAPAVVQLIDW